MVEWATRSSCSRTARVDRRVAMAVDVAPERRDAVEVAAALGVDQVGALAALDHQRLFLAPALLLGERVPDVVAIELRVVGRIEGDVSPGPGGSRLPKAPVSALLASPHADGSTSNLPSSSTTTTTPTASAAAIARLGKLLGGAEESGISVYELPPGQAICPYHYEYGRRSGCWCSRASRRCATPRAPSGSAPWDVVFFEKGPAGAHGVRNETEATARVLMFSTVVVPTATVYPDSDKVGIWTGDPETDVMVRRESTVEYFDGESYVLCGRVIP